MRPDPLGVAVDVAGSVYFTSTLNFVFKLHSSGVLTQIAGNSTGADQAAATNGDGTVNTALNPVGAGDYLTLCATGLGDVTRIASAPQLPLSVTIGGIPATVRNAGQPDNQVTIKIPRGVPPGGYVPVALKAGDASTTDGAVWIAVSGNTE
jgi:uncharacterized protein (TIGR03437 family)